MNQHDLINLINSVIPEARATTTGEFYGVETGLESEGIWIRGSEEYAADGRKIFDYLNTNSLLHHKLQKLVIKVGWYVEPYDSGTCMLWK